jgi:hypothetical protein
MKNEICEHICFLLLLILVQELKLNLGLKWSTGERANYSIEKAFILASRWFSSTSKPLRGDLER